MFKTFHEKSLPEGLFIVRTQMGQEYFATRYQIHLGTHDEWQTLVEADKDEFYSDKEAIDAGLSWRIITDEDLVEAGYKSIEDFNKMEDI